jgi:hypothetical protein
MCGKVHSNKELTCGYINFGYVSINRLKVKRVGSD